MSPSTPTERHLDLLAHWMRVIVAGERPRKATAHLFPAHYNTAFCGFSAERTARGFLFSREPAESEDRRCATCRLVARGSRFNSADAEAG